LASHGDFWLSSGFFLRASFKNFSRQQIDPTESAAEVGLPSAAVDESNTNTSSAVTTEETEVNLDDINVANDASALV
jgi:hypothetical protein